MFHRLKINDMSDSGNQPMYLDNISMMCNGEIYNYRILKDKYNIIASDIIEGIRRIK